MFFLIWTISGIIVDGLSKRPSSCIESLYNIIVVRRRVPLKCLWRCKVVNNGCWDRSVSWKSRIVWRSGCWTLYKWEDTYTKFPKVLGEYVMTLTCVLLLIQYECSSSWSISDIRVDVSIKRPTPYIKSILEMMVIL